MIPSNHLILCINSLHLLIPNSQFVSSQYDPTLQRGFSWWLSGNEFTCNAGDTGSILGLEGTPELGNGSLVFLPGKSHGQRKLAGYSPWGCKELDTT